MSSPPLALIASTALLALVQGCGSSEPAQSDERSGAEPALATPTQADPAAADKATLAGGIGDYASLFALSQVPCSAIDTDALASIVKVPAASIEAKPVWAACEYTWPDGSDIPHRLRIQIDPKQQFDFQAELEMTRDPSSRVRYSENQAARADYLLYVDKGRQAIAIPQTGQGALVIAFRPQATGELPHELLEARAGEAVEVARYLFDQFRKQP